MHGILVRFVRGISIMETGELVSKIDLTGAIALTIVGALDPEIKSYI